MLKADALANEMHCREILKEIESIEEFENQEGHTFSPTQSYGQITMGLPHSPLRGYSHLQAHHGPWDRNPSPTRKGPPTISNVPDILSAGIAGSKLGTIESTGDQASGGQPFALKLNKAHKK